MNETIRPTAYEFGDFRVDVLKRALLLRVDGRSLPLSARAFDALLFFLEHPGELIDKSTLMAAVWPKVVVEENNLNQHISALRRTLGERPEDHRFIVTVPGRGFRFVAAVHRVPGGAIAAPTSTNLAPDDPVVKLAEKTPASPAVLRRGPRAAFWVLGAAVLVVVGFFAWYVVHLQEWRAGQASLKAPTSVDVVPVRTPRLAIMPFENLSPDPDNAFFADGLHEEIISTVAERVPGIEVISRTTMMSYRTNPPKPLGVVARELSASHLLEGSVRREGNRVRLTLQLIDARTDGDIWSASYDRTLGDALTLESQVAEEIAAKLPAHITRRGPSEVAPIKDTEAFDLYLKALLALRDFSAEPKALQQIEDLLARVIARQPDFARAYAQRARARTLMFIASQDVSDASVRLIRSDLDAAKRLAPKDPLVLAATGYFLMCANDTSGALEAYAAAEAAGLTDAEWLIPKAHLLLRRSRIDELNTVVERMLALDPADPLVIYFATFDLHHARQPLDALRAAEYARDAFPSLYAAWRGVIAVDYAGRTDQLHKFVVEHYESPGASPDPTSTLTDYVELLTREHRYAELRAHIDHLPGDSGIYLSGVDFGPIGPTPKALFRGWTDLLLADRKSAAEDGRAVLRFVEQQPRTRWNAAHLESLIAAGRVFTGECGAARAAGKTLLGLVSRADDAVIWTTRAWDVARVDAWCGAPEEAVALLRDLSVARPGLGPGAIARDPVFTVPLANDPAFRALSAELERAIRATPISKLDAPG
jgi:TolB-like protein/DNA-binding winged helix-turn-helix (wHTH) protein